MKAYAVINIFPYNDLQYTPKIFLNREIAQNYCSINRRGHRYTSHEVIEIDIDETNATNTAVERITNRPLLMQFTFKTALNRIYNEYLQLAKLQDIEIKSLRQYIDEAYQTERKTY